MHLKPLLLVIFLTVFIYLPRFGIVLPLLPLYADMFGPEVRMISVLRRAFTVRSGCSAHGGGYLRAPLGRCAGVCRARAAVSK